MGWVFFKFYVYNIPPLRAVAVGTLEVDFLSTFGTSDCGGTPRMVTGFNPFTEWIGDEKQMKRKLG